MIISTTLSTFFSTIFSPAVISNFIIPLLSLAGLVVGIILSRLAQEELQAGKKYFTLLYRLIFVILSTLLAYYLSLTSVLVAVLAILLFLLLLITDYLQPRPWLFLVQYIFFIVGYFLSGKKLLIAAILFLYGLPIGTLLGEKLNKKNKK